MSPGFTHVAHSALGGWTSWRVPGDLTQVPGQQCWLGAGNLRSRPSRALEVGAEGLGFLEPWSLMASPPPPPASHKAAQIPGK